MKQMIESVDVSVYLADYQARKNAGGANILDKDDFLKLLIAQMRYQDPLNPMEDKDFIVQMAQFSTLEQMFNLNSSMEKLVATEKQNMMILFSQFIGKEITWHRPVETGSGEDSLPVYEEGTGKVAAIRFENDTVRFVLDDGTVIAPANVSRLAETSVQNAFLQACNLIGKTVTYIDDHNQEHKATVTAVSRKDGNITFCLENGQTGITADQIIKIE